MDLLSKRIALLVAIITLASCGKKYTCSYNLYYNSVSAVFKGFSASELSKVKVETYNPNGQYNNVISIDTFDYSNADFMNDTAYSENGFGADGLYSFNPGKDYKITIIATNQVYEVSNIHEGEKTYTWEADSRCSPGSSQVRICPYFLDLNHQPVTAFSMTTNHFLISLNH